MTSVAAPVQFAQTTEIFETTVYDSVDDETQHIDDEDTEMTDAGAQDYHGGSDFDDQEMYNAEVGSTIVEPPQSDAVHTHAPSTILDEMEYLEEVDYEEENPVSKEPDVHLVPETASYKPDTTTAQTPPAESQIHPNVFSPASRMIPVPRPSTPHLSNLTATTDDDLQDDDWPICLYTPMGQEYMLFRSDGDTEALFEDNWLKSQPLETLFSSIRQTLENELASLTTSFAMDEIVLAVPDLDVSIAEDNCYTREITLQDLVNLINSLCTRNGTDRAATCKLQLSLQPRFIARFNQLVSITSQSVDTAQKTGDDSQDVEESHEGHETHGEQEVLENETDQVDDFHEEDEQPAVEEPTEGEHEEVYEDYEGDENAEDAAEYEDNETAEVQVEGQSEDHLNLNNSEEVTTADDAEAVQASEHDAGGLAEDEEDELYEENEESYDPALQSTETLVNEEDVDQEDIEEQDEVDIVEPFEENTEESQGYEEEHEEYDEEAQDEEQTDEHEEQPNTTEPEQSLDSSGQNDEDKDDDDLISYEEAVDQTEDGQDYRQQYISEDQIDDTTDHPAEGSKPVNGSTDETVAENTSSGRNSPGSKRSLNQVVDPSVEDQAPPSKRAKS